MQTILTPSQRYLQVSFPPSLTGPRLHHDAVLSILEKRKIFLIESAARGRQSVGSLCSDGRKQVESEQKAQIRQGDAPKFHQTDFARGLGSGFDCFHAQLNLSPSGSTSEALLLSFFFFLPADES